MKRLLFWCLVALTTAGDAAAEPARLMVDGKTRTYLLERPAEQAPYPTLIMLHGGGGTAEQEMRFSGLAQLGPRQGFAAAFPEAVGGLWNFFRSGKETAQHVEFF